MPFNLFSIGKLFNKTWEEINGKDVINKINPFSVDLVLLNYSLPS